MKPMLIAQISDTHIRDPEAEDDPKFRKRVQALEAFVRHVDALDEKPDLIIHSGDVTHDGAPAYYQVVKDAMQGLSMPVHFAAGNRDKGENLIAALNDLGGAEMIDGFVIYDIDRYPVRLIAMDTRHREHNIGTTCSVRLGILDDMLKARPDIPTAIFMHHPPFRVTAASDDYQFQFDDPVLADAFLDLVAQHSQVVHMFCGHMHRQYSTDLQTCRASCVPSLPADNRMGTYPPGLEGQPLYQMHRWNADKRLFETELCAALWLEA